MTASSLDRAAPGVGRGAGPFAPYHAWDRNFFLIWAALIWLGVMMGFGPQIADHIRTHAKPYPPIVHVHAAVFMSWLVLFTGQILLIRARRSDLHRKLGFAMVGLAGVMAILGPATALVADAAKLGTPASDPSFVAIQFTDIAAFVGLLGSAVAFRNVAPIHKRLVLMSTIYISDAGFARWLGGPLHGLLGDGPAAFWAFAYSGTAILFLGLGAYDLITRRRLHPAYLGGLAWVAVCETMALSLYFSAAWKPVATSLVRLAA
jgi:hypothetical protein